MPGRTLATSPRCGGIMQRLDKDEYGMAIARAVALRSTCPRRAVGAVLMKDGRIISTGYNGAPPGMKPCLDRGSCLMFEGHCINTIHGEMNALLRARETGDTLITTDQPCLPCLKACLSHNRDIKIVYWRKYEDPARDHFMVNHAIMMQGLREVHNKKIEEFLRNA